MTKNSETFQTVAVQFDTLEDREAFRKAGRSAGLSMRKIDPSDAFVIIDWVSAREKSWLNENAGFYSGWVKPIRPVSTVNAEAAASVLVAT